jgi:hypothetical protein
MLMVYYVTLRDLNVEMISDGLGCPEKTLA